MYLALFSTMMLVTRQEVMLEVRSCQIPIDSAYISSWPLNKDAGRSHKPTQIHRALITLLMVVMISLVEPT